MNEELREVLAENEAKRNKEQKTEQVINPLDYVTISVKQYTKMIRKIERLKAELTDSERAIELTKENEQHTRWWREEQKKTEKLTAEVAELRTNLDEAKAQIAEMVGLGELKKVGDMNA